MAALQQQAKRHVSLSTEYAPDGDGRPALVQPKSLSSKNGILDTSVIFDVATFSWPELGIKITTRAFNYSFPSTTLRVKRGDRLRVTLTNKLTNSPGGNSTPIPRRDGWEGINDSDTGLYEDVGQVKFDKTRMWAYVNNLHNANHTNFHTHGMHVSQYKPEDNVVDVTVGPGESFEYTYDFSAYHSGGNSWYHPHLHGTTALQVGGGAVGAIIVDDSPGEIPRYIADMPEVVAVLQEEIFNYFGTESAIHAKDDPAMGCMPFGSVYTEQCWKEGRTTLMSNLSKDDVFKVETLPGFGFGPGQKAPVRHFFTINGQYQPSLAMDTTKWVRIRLIYGGHVNPINLVITTADSANQTAFCEMQLISKDNVYIREFPRQLLMGAWLAPGGRAQVLVQCSKPGRYALRQVLPVSGAPSPAGNQTILYFDVQGDVSKPVPLAKVFAQWPRYTQCLLKYPLWKIAKPYVGNQNVSNFTYKMLYDDGITLKSDQYIDKVGERAQGLPQPRLLPDRPPNDQLPYADEAWKKWPVRFTMNNQTFMFPNQDSRDQSPKAMRDMAYQALIPTARVVQFMPGGLQAHAWHMHTNPVQIQTFGDSDYMAKWGGYFQPGDWHDTIQLPGAGPLPENTTLVVRFQTDCYSGPLVIHCHILPMEDLGMFTLVYSTGSNHQWNREFHQSGVFKFPPAQCLKRGAKCPKPYCSNYKY